MNKIITAVLSLAFLSACEKDINFNLKSAGTLLVVDASIENGLPPVVVLTTSLNFFSTVDAALLDSTFVHDALVTISNGALTHHLKEHSSKLGGGITVYSYGIDSASLSTAFNGALNTHYTLTIQSEGKTYIAATDIPGPGRKVDSIWWKAAPFTDDTSKVVLMAKFTDPPGLGNYTRYFTKKNKQAFLPGQNSVLDDQVIDGTTFQLQVDPGVNRDFPVAINDNYFKRGDSITYKICNIDKPAFTFWSTWEFAYSSIGNPFSQPNQVIGNISNGALGDFYGYSAGFKTLAVPK